MATTVSPASFGHGPADTLGLRRDAAPGWLRMLVASIREPQLAFGRPTWRGRLHAWGFAVAFPAGVMLTLSANGASHRAAAAIYVTTLMLSFGTSASYHRMTRSERSRRIMQKLDHAMIYLLIAGTATPLCVVALPNRWGVTFLGCQMMIAAIGIVLTFVAFERGRKLAYALYPAMVVTLLAVGPLFVSSLSPLQAILMGGGVAAYAIGAPVLMRRRPDPWPTSFGYHEVFHAATIVAATLHFLAIRDLLA